VKLPFVSRRSPRSFLFIGSPAVAFLATIGVSLGLSGGHENAAGPPPPTLAVALSNEQQLPQPTATPSPTAVPIRTECDEIRGTEYRSAAERDWYQENCKSVAPALTVSSGGVRPVTGPPPPAASAQYPLGDTLIIPSIGVNAPVYGAHVVDGTMADPVGYFNAVWYDFSDFPGLGGYATGGNLVMAGHVDSAVYGAAVFYYMRNLAVGDAIQYRTSEGELFTYVVTGVGDYLPSDNWTGIVSSATADLTLITCIGTFDRSIREYSHRRVVFASRV
jgi:LPXTG-site transpeptidase (sortase) family protein